MKIKIGETIHVLGEHQRMYQTYIVAGETSRSWLLAGVGQKWVAEFFSKDPTRYARYCTKLAKCDIRTGRAKLGTDRDVAINKWVLDNGWKIRERVGTCTTDETMIAIAKLVGYPVPDFWGDLWFTRTV